MSFPCSIRSYLHRLQVAHSLLFTLYPTKLSIPFTPNIIYLLPTKVFRDRKTTPQTQDLNRHRHRHIHIYNVVLHDATIAHQIVFIIPAQQFNQIIIIIIIIILVVVGVALC